MPKINPIGKAPDRPTDSHGIQLANIAQRIVHSSDQITRLILETRELRLKAAELECKQRSGVNKNSVQGVTAQHALASRAAAQKRTTEWVSAMGGLMAEIERLEVYLLKFDTWGDRFRQELRSLQFRIPTAKSSRSPLAFVSDEDSVLGGLRRLRFLMEELANGPLAPPTPASSHPKGFDGLKQKKQDLSHYFDRAPLTDRQRDCISLHFEFGLSYRKIAQRLGIHLTTVQDHIRRAEVKLKLAHTSGSSSRH